MLRRLFLLAVLPLSCGFLFAAQSSGPSPSPSQQDPSQPQAQKPSPSLSAEEMEKDKKKPKKVWTNDELSSLNKMDISVVGSVVPDRKSNSAPRTQASSLATRYREALRRLRADLDVLDKRITSLRNFKADNPSPSGGIKITGYYSTVPIPEQINQLEAKRKQIQAQIDALEDEARHNGIPPGELR